MPTVKTSELAGAALNWAVRQCVSPGTRDYVAARDNFSTCWAKGGPIIDSADIDILRDGAAFGARTGSMTKHPQRDALTWNLQRGPTKLVAAMRCFVASRLGDSVDVPAELA